MPGWKVIIFDHQQAGLNFSTLEQPMVNFFFFFFFFACVKTIAVYYWATWTTMKQHNGYNKVC